jgi:hypothetical protein
MPQPASIDEYLLFGEFCHSFSEIPKIPGFASEMDDLKVNILLFK